MRILVNSAQFGQLETRLHTITTMNASCGWEVGDMWLLGAQEFKW